MPRDTDAAGRDPRPPARGNGARKAGRRPGALDPAASPLALFGSELRVYRDRAGLSQEQLGLRARYTGSFVGAVERAREMPRREFAQACDRELGIDDALTRLWDGLLKSSVYPPWFDWPEHEAEAVMLRAFQLSVVDGLLQTPEYARALLGGNEPAVEARLARQTILTRDDPPPPMLVCLLDASLLYREIGSPDVMRAQLHHLVEMVSDRVAVLVVPAGPHLGISGSFVLATLPNRSEVAYVETAARGITTGEPDDIRTLAEAFESIRSQALPQDQSIDLITGAVETRWS